MNYINRRFKRLPQKVFDTPAMIMECHNLQQLPTGLRARHNLLISNCQTLQSLPEDVYVAGDLVIANCAEFTTLPTNLFVGRMLLVSNCPKFNGIPEGIGWYESAQKSSDAKHLSAPYVGTHIHLHNVGIEYLPVMSRINGDLILEHCSKLKRLPDGLVVTKFIYLTGCNNVVIPRGTQCTSIVSAADKYFMYKDTVLRTYGRNDADCIFLNDINAPEINTVGDLSW